METILFIDGMNFINKLGFEKTAGHGNLFFSNKAIFKIDGKLLFIDVSVLEDEIINEVKSSLKI